MSGVGGPSWYLDRAQGVQREAEILRNVAEIETYSVKQWGRRAASKYLADIEAALGRLQIQPELLQPERELHAELCFYRVNKDAIRAEQPLAECGHLRHVHPAGRCDLVVV